MGIDPIRYKPWKGERSGTLDRILVMAKSIFQQKIKNKWFLAVLIMSILPYVILLFVFALVPHEDLDPATISLVLSGEQFTLFGTLLIAMVCSDLLSEDFRNNSFVLYFSRSLKAEGYLAGKFLGAFILLSINSFILPVVLALTLIGTQTGPDYGTSFVVLLKTVLVGLVGTIFFIPMGLFISSLTTKKTHATAGIFAMIMVFTILGAIFSGFDANWLLISPSLLFLMFSEVVFGFGLPNTISEPLFAVMFIGFILVPLALVYLRIHLKAVGK